MAGYRPPYTPLEDRAIIRFFIDNKMLHLYRGNTVYLKMEEENICPNRTWQSLKTRFMKTIMQQLTLPAYGLSDQDKKYMKETFQISKNSKVVNYDPILTQEVREMQMKRAGKKKPKAKSAEAASSSAHASDELDKNWYKFGSSDSE